MLVISNNCVGGYLYNHLGKPYNNPFIWHRMSYDSTYNTMKNWGNINWLDYEFEKSTYKPNTFNINVENKIKINYSHYLFDPKATTIQKDKKYDKSKYDFWTGDVRYCRIWEVVNEKYLTRTERMQNNTEDPVFLIRDDERFVKTISSKHTIQEIADLDVPYKRIILTDNKNLKTANKLCKIIYVKNIYEHPDILVKNNLETIKTHFGLL